MDSTVNEPSRDRQGHPPLPPPPGGPPGTWQGQLGGYSYPSGPLGLPAYPAPPIRPATVLTTVVPRGPLTWAGGLLVLHLLLAIAATTVSWINRDDLSEVAMEGWRESPAAEKFAVQMLVLRVAENLVFLVSFLLLLRGVWRGKWQAWWRLIYLAVVGASILGFLVIVQRSPLLKALQGWQIIVLLALVAMVAHPAIRAHCAKRRR